MNDKLLQSISKIIIKYAKSNEVVEYNKISKELGGAISPIRLNQPLGEISLRCIQHGFPPLSAIVVNHETQFPGDGFFTWVAEKMGRPNLPATEWKEFFEQQKSNVYRCDNWDLFLETVFDVTFQKINITTDIVNIIDLLSAKEYQIGQPTRYYILTIKAFYDTQQNGPYKYEVIVLDNDKVVKQSTVEDREKKQLLTPAKVKGMELLFESVTHLTLDDLTMVHYKPDRPSIKKWEKEPTSSTQQLYREKLHERIRKTVEKDIESETAQEDTFYKDGKAIQYYGTRYERNPLNRAEAIRIHGVTCKVCRFNFQEVYGERGRDFIEIHHIKPLHTLGNEIQINPATDLVPICSNCHRMIHRDRDHVLRVEELRELLKR